MPPQNGSVTTGEDASIRLSCLATGTEPLVYQWWDGQGNRLVDGADNGKVHVNGSSLVVNNVTANDEGFYTCSVSNAGGMDVERAYIVLFGQ